MAEVDFIYFRSQEAAATEKARITASFPDVDFHFIDGLELAEVSVDEFVERNNIPLAPERPAYGGGSGELFLSGSSENTVEVDMDRLVAGTGALHLAFQEYEKPLYGTCFTHQLLAAAHGGKVDEDPNGGEVGLVELDSGLVVAQGHLDSVVAEPGSAKVVDGSATTPIQALAYFDDAGNVSAITNQGHFELTGEQIGGIVDGNDVFTPTNCLMGEDGEPDYTRSTRITNDMLRQFFHRGFAPFRVLYGFNGQSRQEDNL